MAEIVADFERPFFSDGDRVKNHEYERSQVVEQAQLVIADIGNGDCVISRLALGKGQMAFGQNRTDHASQYNNPFNSNALAKRDKVIGVTALVECQSLLDQVGIAGVEISGFEGGNDDLKISDDKGASITISTKPIMDKLVLRFSALREEQGSANAERRLALGFELDV